MNNGTAIYIEDDSLKDCPIIWVMLFSTVKRVLLLNDNFLIKTNLYVHLLQSLYPEDFFAFK